MKESASAYEDAINSAGSSTEEYQVWLDYRKFQKWFDGNYNGVQGVSMTITRCLISNANLVYNPNNSAIVPTEINSYLKKDNKDADKLKSLAEKYHSCITEDVYEILTEDIYGEE